MSSQCPCYCYLLGKIAGCTYLNHANADMLVIVQIGVTTGAALLENNEASPKLTTANGRTFT